MKRKSFVFVLVLILALSLLAIPVGAKPSGTVNVQILALNDFHGNLEYHLRVALDVFQQYLVPCAKCSCGGC